MRIVRFALTNPPPAFDAAREFYERTERVSEYLSRIGTGDSEPVVRDFPWSAEEAAVLPLLARRGGFDHFCLEVDGDKEEALPQSPMDKLMLFLDTASPDWLRFNEPIEVERAETLRIFDISDIEHVPAHLFPRNHPRHDSCIPIHLPDRDSLRCVSSKEARGVIQRLGDATPRFPRIPESSEGNEEIYVQSIDPSGSRGLLCFENSHQTGEAYLVYFSDQDTFRNCDVFRYGLAPKTPKLKGTVFEVLLTAERLQILDVLLLNDADQRDLPNVAARLVSAYGAIEALREVWGDFVAISSVLLRKRGNLGPGSAVILPTRYLCSQARSHPYRPGPDPMLSILDV
jgi:hypothetical protein